MSASHVDQLPLFEAAPEPIDLDRPRCKLCARPAWLRGDGLLSAYCTSTSCSNRVRICQVPECGREFIQNADGAGTRYCSIECKRVGYRPLAAEMPACAWGCGHRPRSRPRGLVWPYICPRCLDPVRHVSDRLKKHRVPHEWARALIAHPYCHAGCGVDILERVKLRHGEVGALLVVDHDHRCCPGAHSCGSCLRGLLCPSCNSAAGMLRDDPSLALKLADYLTANPYSLHNNGRTYP